MSQNIYTKRFIHWALDNGGDVRLFTKALNAAVNKSTVLNARVDNAVQNSSRDFKKKMERF